MNKKLLLIVLLIFANNVFSFSINDREELCNDGDVAHCRELIYEYSNENNKAMTDKYFDITQKIYLENCDKNNFEHCANFGFMMQQKGDKTLFNGNQYYELAKEFFKKSCDGRKHHGCSGLGFMYINGKGVIKNHILGKHYLKKSEKYLKEGCPVSRGGSVECGYLSILYVNYYEKTGQVLFRD